MFSRPVAGPIHVVVQCYQAAYARTCLCEDLHLWRCELLQGPLVGHIHGQIQMGAEMQNGLCAGFVEAQPMYMVYVM